MMLSFGEAVRQFYRNYANADGRAQRSAYWWVQLYQTIILAVLLIVVVMADGGPELFEGLLKASTPDALMPFWAALGFSGKAAIYCAVIFSLVNFLPGIMIAIRRFHDLDRSGWLVLVFMIAGNLPYIGILPSLANIIWFTFPGTDGPNQYGQDPLGRNTDVFR